MSETFPPPDANSVVGSASIRDDQSTAAAIALSAAAATAVGAASGALWGGIGGRIAMRIVFLTSNDGNAGLTSDDGFEIGTFSGATVFLLIFTAILGAIVGLVVGVLRAITIGPTWVAATGIAIATAAAGGAAVVHTDGVDFRILEPLWLTVGLFVLLPGLWAATVVVVTDRLLRSTHLAGEPVRLDRGRWRAIGWVLLVVITTLGVQDLVADVASLG